MWPPLAFGPLFGTVTFWRCLRRPVSGPGSVPQPRPQSQHAHISWPGWLWSRGVWEGGCVASKEERTKCSITLRPLLLSLFARGGVDRREGHPAAERVVLWGCNRFENGEPFSHLLEALYGLAAALKSCGLPLLGSTPLPR